jgi:hypothetical protein
MKATCKLAAGALAAGLALPALAMTQVSIPQPRIDNGITYLSGGIGHEEALAMKAEARNYPLSMVFSEGKHGEYLAAVNVTIRSSLGRPLLTTVSEGPIMLLKLPAGEYKIAATINGKTLRRSVIVGKRGDMSLSFNWPQV